jgi:UDP-N-acetylglucosamine transferase subunit ALG13
MIFLTVGTSFPFDRLVTDVDFLVSEGVVNDEIFAQVGIGGKTPLNFDSVEILPKEEFDIFFKKSHGIISHAGMGTISMALEMNKPILVMPRLKKHGELVNGHQEATAKYFEKNGHILAAHSREELALKVVSLPFFKPAPRINHIEEISQKVADFILESEKIFNKKKRKK